VLSGSYVFEKDVRLTRIFFALNANDNPVSLIGRHSTFWSIYEKRVASSVLVRRYRYWTLPEFLILCHLRYSAEKRLTPSSTFDKILSRLKGVRAIHWMALGFGVLILVDVAVGLFALQ
jgi:hypothetical protein